MNDKTAHPDPPEHMWWCFTCHGGIGVWGGTLKSPPRRCPECHGNQIAPLPYTAATTPPSTNSEEVVNELVVGINEPSEEMMEKMARLIHAAMFDEDGDDALIEAGKRTRWQDYKLHAECVLWDIAALTARKEG